MASSRITVTSRCRLCQQPVNICSAGAHPGPGSWPPARPPACPRAPAGTCRAAGRSLLSAQCCNPGMRDSSMHEMLAAHGAAGWPEEMLPRRAPGLATWPWPCTGLLTHRTRRGCGLAARRAPHDVQLADDGRDAAARVEDGHAVHHLGRAVLAHLQVVLPARQAQLTCPEHMRLARSFNKRGCRLDIMHCQAISTRRCTACWQSQSASGPSCVLFKRPMQTCG